MKKMILITSVLISTTVFTQVRKEKAGSKVSDRYASGQPQDLSVPPPPSNVFPAQFPEGNKIFVKKVEQNLNKEALKTLSKILDTQIILKIDEEGNVLNISTYGKNETFNNEVKTAVIKTADMVKWEPGKNNWGEKVIDIVKIPFRYKNQ